MLRKITVLIAWRGRKDNKYKEKQIGQSWLSILQYNLSLVFCLPNMNFLSFTVAEISVSKICGEKEKRTYTRKNKQENACSQSHDATSHCQFTYKILTFYLEQLLRNLFRKIAVLIAWKERKDNTYQEEKTGQSRLSIPRYNLSLLFCIPSMNFLSYTVVEISLTKNVERKKNG